MNDPPAVLQVVVSSGFLGVLMIDEVIRPLSKEFDRIGQEAIDAHSAFVSGLLKANAEHKFHYCRICERPYVDDGSWQGDLCNCQLEEATHGHEIKRREHLKVLQDPRLDPSFSSLHVRKKALRISEFVLTEICPFAFSCVSGSSWLYRMTAVPFLLMGCAAEFKLFNQTAFDLLSICIIIDVLRKEFASSGRDCTLTNLVLEIAANQDQAEAYNVLLNDDEACMQKFCSAPDTDLIASVRQSFLKILLLHPPGTDLIVENIKQLGNSIGTFLTDKENAAFTFLSIDQIQDILNDLPATFVWMPMYGGSKETYVPPENLFADHKVHLG